MLEKNLNVLEFNKIIDLVCNYSNTYIGKEKLKNLAPSNNSITVKELLEETFEALNLIYRKGQPEIANISDIDIWLKNLRSYNPLSAKALLDVASVLRTARVLHEYFFGDKEFNLSEFTSLEPLFSSLYFNKTIENKIFTSIIDENTIADDASSELKNIRKNIKNKEQEIKLKLSSYLQSKYIQEPVITMRSGRFVIPVKNEYRSEIKGFIHDISSSGSTVFIEPISVFDLNNDLNHLKNDENIEIEKILQKLSSLFFNITDFITNNVNLIGLIDFIFAKAKYSNSLNAIEPIISNKKIINLKMAWHPLIDKNTAIKNDISIGENYTSLIITGPNTGGKTVTLKTAGLLTLMAMSGLHITANEGSCVYFFDNIFADIGDEQSISDSLSTFSSHMTNIASILNEATENSFILLDELGSGTDPVEGANLAISILEKLYSLNTLTLSTTHYPELKHFALVTDGFENASVEFNLDTLSPTYKLLIGIPGTSNAFSISRKLGISEEIISRAKELMSSDKINIEDLLNNIYENKKIIETEKEKILEDSKKVQNLKNSLEEDYSKLQNTKKELVAKAKSEARDILLSAKEDANEIIKQIENSSNNKEINKLRNKLNEKINNLNVVNSKESNSNKKINLSDLKIGTEVFIKKINQTGTVISISKDGKIQVQLSLGKMFFNIDELEISKISNKNNKTYSSSSKKDFKVKAVSSEINVIGQNIDEACFTIDKFLDNCALSSLNTVRIVHGKGTGALRTGIHKFLKNHPHVKSFRIGTFGEGETGVTIVELK